MMSLIWEMKLKPETPVNSLRNNSDCSSDGDKLNVNLFHILSHQKLYILALTDGCRSTVPGYGRRGAFATPLVFLVLDRFLRERGSRSQTRRESQFGRAFRIQ